MAEEIIKDTYYRIVDYIETKPNGDKIGKVFYRRIVGCYEASTNVTKDSHRRIVAHGDVLSSLVVEANSKSKQAVWTKRLPLKTVRYGLFQPLTKCMQLNFAEHLSSWKIRVK